jgi:uncharacterized membrane protein YfcA
VVAGSLVGTRALRSLRNSSIRKVFVPILLLLAAEMLLHGV